MSKGAELAYMELYMQNERRIWNFEDSVIRKMAKQMGIEYRETEEIEEIKKKIARMQTEAEFG